MIAVLVIVGLLIGLALLILVAIAIGNYGDD